MSNYNNNKHNQKNDFFYSYKKSNQTGERSTVKKIKSKFLEQKLQVIIHFHHLVNKYLSHMQVSKMLSTLIFMHYIFSKIMLFKNKTCMFIESPLHQTHENYQESNCCSQERPRATKFFCGKQ